MGSKLHAFFGMMNHAFILQMSLCLRAFRPGKALTGRDGFDIEHRHHHTF